MSIIIKGMEMPTGCAFCKIKKRNGGKMVCPLCNEEWDIHDPMSSDFRLESCPLVPVPTHGRLIDGDYAEKDLIHDYAYAAAQMVKNYPTIIPAEEGKT